MRGQKPGNPRKIVFIGTEPVQQHQRFTFAAFQINILKITGKIYFLALKTGTFAFHVYGKLRKFFRSQIKKPDIGCDTDNNKKKNDLNDSHLRFPC